MVFHGCLRQSGKGGGLLSKKIHGAETGPASLSRSNAHFGILPIWSLVAPGALRYNPAKAEKAAYGPRKGSNPPPRSVKQSETLTSSPRAADTGRKWKEGVYVKLQTPRTRLA